MSDLFGSASPRDGAAPSLQQQVKRALVATARALTRKEAQVRRQKLLLGKLEDEARELRRELRSWLGVEVPERPEAPSDAPDA